MKKRILVGGLHHESDTFNPIITDRSDIWVLRGKEIIERRGKGSIDGIIARLEEAGYEIIPTIIARATPNGEWDENYYLELKEELLNGIKEAGKLDALCLSLHGSMRVKNIGEAEGDLLSSIRDIVGPSMPIYTSLDMHATITNDMIRYADAYVGYKFAPHTDTYETGLHIADILVKALETGKKATMKAVRIPMLIAGEQSETSTEPMKSLIQELREYEKLDKVLACNYLLGFPWADTDQNGVTTVVVTEEDPNLAENLAMTLAQLFYSKREEFTFYNETREPLDTLDHAYKATFSQRPVVISDSGDNPTAGSSGDNTEFLKMCFNHDVATLDPPLVYQAIYDKEVLKLAFSKKEGDEFDVTLGSKYAPLMSTPVKERAKLIKKYENYERMHNVNLALLLIKNIHVVVMDKHEGCYDPDMLRALGLDPEKASIIVMKLGYLEPEIRAISKRHIMALTTGASYEVLEKIKYKNIQRPIYPLDKDFEVFFEIL